MPFLVAGAVAAGGSLLGGILGSSAKKKAAAEKRRLHNQAMGIYGDFMKDPNYSPLRGEQMYKNAIGSIQGAFREAKGNLSMAGTTARQSITTGGARASAGMQQSMMSRGLFGTTAFDNAQRGISSDVSRNLASVNENVGRMMAGLATQRGMATAQAQQSLGQFYGQAASMRQNQVENYINLLRDKPERFSRTAAFGNALGQAAGTFGSLYAMGAMMGPAAGASGTFAGQDMASGLGSDPFGFLGGTGASASTTAGTGYGLNLSF